MPDSQQHHRAQGLSKGRALDLRPSRNNDVREEQRHQDSVQLSYPVTLKPWFAKWGRRFKLWNDEPMRKRLELDSMGKTCWDLVDGNRSVEDIIQEFVRLYQLHPREAELSVTSFLRELGRRGLIGMR